MSFTINILKIIKINTIAIVLTCLLVISCNSDAAMLDPEIPLADGIVEIVEEVDSAAANDYIPVVEYLEIPLRTGDRPVTTMGVPHIQIDVSPVTAVNEELYRRVFSVPGIERHASVIGGWQGMWISDEVTILVPDAIIGGREFGHIHDDGSLHIFLEPERSTKAVESGWAIYHPFAVQQREGWDGFVMLYTPQTIEELNVTFQLIMDAFNYITGQNLLATDYY